MAAALLILTHQRVGDWTVVVPRDIGEMLEGYMKRPRQPTWMTNPFLRPDFHELQRRGYLDVTEDWPSGPIGFSEAGFERLRRRVYPIDGTMAELAPADLPRFGPGGTR